MSEVNLAQFTAKFRNINKELLLGVESSDIEKIEAWVKQREALVSNLFDKLNEKVGIEPNKASVKS